MTFNAKILADSTNTLGNRLLTMEMTYPRFVHAEHLRHRMFSFNVASSRAIPVEKMIEQVEKNPVIPIHWGKAQKGMQAYEELDDTKSIYSHTEAAGSMIERNVYLSPKELCKERWLRARDSCVVGAKRMRHLGLHKQIINRILEPWMWCTVICTGNIGAWNNFWALRCHPEAEPHIRKIAEMTEGIARNNVSHQLAEGEWHLPLIGFDGDELLSVEDQVKVSAGRCARVSYLTHEGVRDPEADIALHQRLVASKHFSPTEHQARSDRLARIDWCDEYTVDIDRNGNLGQGWTQYRKTLKGEYQDER